MAIGVLKRYPKKDGDCHPCLDGTANVTRDGVAYVSQNIPSGGAATIDVVSSGEWVAPAEWLDISGTSGQMAKVLVAVHSPANIALGYTNHIAILARAAYTVDWGDGVVEDFADNVVAEHIYDYDDFTMTDFRGYRQAIITITPQAGNNLTIIEYIKHTGMVPYQYSNSILDVNVVGTHLTYLPFYSTTNICGMLERVIAKQSTTSCTNMSSMFYVCNSLRSLDLSSFNTANVTNMSFMFYVCSSLQSLDLSSFNTANVTDMSSMFRNCFVLESLDLSSFNTANVTSMGGMFQGASSLIEIDLSHTTLASVTTNTTITSNNRTATKIRLPNIGSQSFTVANGNMARAALVALFGDLRDRTALPALTLTITGNPGVADLIAADYLIATNKNWIITS